MALPQMGNVVLQFGSPATLKVATKTVVDHRPSVTYVESSIVPTVQPATMRMLLSEGLEVSNLDFSLERLMVHTVSVLAIGDRIEWQSKTYKVVNLGNYNLYGFYECFAEEVKDTATPGD